MEICGRVFKDLKERETPDSRAGGQFPFPVFLFFLRSFSFLFLPHSGFYL